MMTVRELINWLSDFDDDTEVVIGMHQRYGTDFAMDIQSISTETVDVWDEDEESTKVVITEGNQIGGVCYDGEEDEYE